MNKTYIKEVNLQKFGSMGEKTGWTYITIDKELTNLLNPGVKKSYRVYCKMDQLEEAEFSILPIGESEFIIPIKKDLQSKLKKKAGDKLRIQIRFNPNPYEINKDFLEYLETEPKAQEFFFSMPKSHQNYFSKWIESTKTVNNKVERIIQAVNALKQKKNYAEMIRSKNT